MSNSEYHQSISTSIKNSTFNHFSGKILRCNCCSLLKKNKRSKMVDKKNSQSGCFRNIRGGGRTLSYSYLDICSQQPDHSSDMNRFSCKFYSHMDMASKGEKLCLGRIYQDKLNSKENLPLDRTLASIWYRMLS